MSRRTIALTDALHRYLVEEMVTETDAMRRLRAETDKLPLANMQIAPEQGQFMQLLVELLGGHKVLEIGTFTGYSAIWLVGGLVDDGALICCDVSEEWTTIARRFWDEAGIADRIDLRLAPALETIDDLLHHGAAGTFDFIFIDADKQNSENYYERSLELLRPGGVVAIDNAFQGGKVADRTVRGEDALHRDLSHKISHDSRVSVSLVPIGDGLLLARKRG